MSLMSEARARKSEVDVAWQPCVGHAHEASPQGTAGARGHAYLFLDARGGSLSGLQTNASFGRSATSGF